VPVVVLEVANTSESDIVTVQSVLTVYVPALTFIALVGAELARIFPAPSNRTFPTDAKAEPPAAPERKPPSAVELPGRNPPADPGATAAIGRNAPVVPGAVAEIGVNSVRLADQPYAPTKSLLPTQVRA